MFNSHRGASEQAGTYQAAGAFKRVYLQIIRELGKRPQRELPAALQNHRSGPRCGDRGLALVTEFDGVDRRSYGFKEERGGCRCVTPHRVLICSEEEGSNPDLFHPTAQRQGFSLQEAVCNTQH